MLLLQHFTKQCNICNILKPFNQFHKKSDCKYGIRPMCKQCRNIQSKIYRDNNHDYFKEYYESNKDEMLEKNRVYYKNNKEKLGINNKQWSINNREKSNNIKKRWAEKNKEKVDNFHRIYRINNKDKIKESQQKFKINNKEKIAFWGKRYRQTDMGRMASFNGSHKRRVKIKQGDIGNKQLVELKNNAKVCYWCNTSLKNKKVHIDHYTPLSKGGCHTFENLVVSCAKCNQNKSAKDPIIFANSIGKLF